MAKQLTQFQSRRLFRRTSSDVKNLVRSYQTQFAELNDEYAKDFGAYQKNVSDLMAPFEASLQEYSEKLEPKYRKEIAEYNAALENYNRKLAEIDADPVIKSTGSVTYREWYGKKKTDTFDVWIPKEVPDFDVEIPKAPGMPKAPKVKAFDSSKFDEKRAEVKQGFEREMGERGSARRNAVRRGQGRTLLQGA